MQALLNIKLGKREKAIKKLTDSFTLAKPRGFVRTFIDLGEEMRGLLTNFPPEHPFIDYAEMLLAAFPAVSQTTFHLQDEGAVLPLLTNREHEIISLLHGKISDQDIADKLFISCSTVKRHTANIYKKLHVKNRREAVSKALSLEVIS